MTARNAAAVASAKANKQVRLERYRELTRVYGLTQKEACSRMSIDRRTGTAYEQILVAETGEDLLTARRQLLMRLRRSGLGPRAAAYRLNIHVHTARRWERAMAVTDA